MSEFFCGNPNNHEQHIKNNEHCNGVNRQEKKEVEIVEKYEPAVETSTKADLFQLLGVKAPDQYQLESWNAGWHDGYDLNPSRIMIEVDAESYAAGYETGLDKACEQGRITINGARGLKGLKPFREAAVPATPVFDPVKIVEHYTPGQNEVANFISAQNLDFNSGNVVKYVSRAGKKDPTKKLQDLEKAAAYLQMAYNVEQGLPAVIRDPETHEIVWTLFKN